MGFKILPIDESDFHEGEPLYDVFELTLQDTWVPRRFREVNAFHTKAPSATPGEIWDKEYKKDDLPVISSPVTNLDVDTFLDCLNTEELTGTQPYNPLYDDFPPLPDINPDDPVFQRLSFGPHTTARTVLGTTSWHRVIHDKIPPESL